MTRPTPTLRAASLDDLGFAGDVYLKTMLYITDRLPDFDEGQHMARFAERFLPHEVRIIVADSKDVGWLQVSETDDEIFLKQMFLRPASQGQGIGSSLLVRPDRAWPPGQQARAAGRSEDQSRGAPL